MGRSISPSLGAIDAQRHGDFVYLRNTANYSSAVVASPEEFAAFLERAKRGEFDALAEGVPSGVQVDALPKAVSA